MEKAFNKETGKERGEGETAMEVWKLICRVWFIGKWRARVETAFLAFHITINQLNLTVNYIALFPLFLTCFFSFFLNWIGAMMTRMGRSYDIGCNIISCEGNQFQWKIEGYGSFLKVHRSWNIRWRSIKYTANGTSLDR